MTAHVESLPDVPRAGGALACRFFLAMALCGCVGDIEGGPTPRSLEVSRAAVTYRTTDAAALVASPLPMSPTQLIGLGDSVAVSDPTSVWSVATGQAPRALVPAEPLGEVKQLARRPSGGLLVLTDRALFHDLDGNLVRSPLSDRLSPGRSGLDALGDELWLFGDADDVEWVGGGEIQSLRLAGAAGPWRVAAVSEGVALFFSGGKAWEADARVPSALALPVALGAAFDSARTADGWLYVATTAGVLERAPSGAYRLLDLRARALAALSNDVVALSSEGLLSLREEPLVLEPVQAGLAPRVARDSNGDTWLLDADGLRVSAPRPLSFAADVAPFFHAHCAGCHVTGLNGSPKIDFEQLAVAVQYASVITQRLEANGVAPMPPTNAEVLTPSQYAVWKRWEGGARDP